MLRYLLQFLFLLVAVRLVFRAVSALLSARSSRPASTPAKRATDLVFDSVCQTYLPRDRAISAIVAGKTRHFCSNECRAKATELLDAAS